MTADLMIRAQGLGKSYVIGHQAEREHYVALRDVLARNARNAARSVRDMVTGRPNVGGDEVEEFWALKDVDFEIRRGEVVGVIGRNGAGKSTLLKVLSRITEPSRGRVEIHGRVASLLEVGTGFHPELTGRENIFLNGAILGMGREETRKKFDEIVAFAEVERFLDTPVKRYSSGMYVRLAFAVAAHLEPEILVVDEVLAVGDAEFQKKCIGKMQDVAGRGRTVLFVSHNMAAVRRLCGRALLLSHGSVITDGGVDTVIEGYLRGAGGQAPEEIKRLIASFPPDPACRMLDIGLSQNGQPRARFESSRSIDVTFDYEVLEETLGFHAFFRLLDQEETVLFESIDTAEAEDLPTIPAGRYRSTASIPANLLGARRYELQLGLAIAHRRYCTPELISIGFDVDLTGQINQAFPGYVSPGRLLPSIPWRIEKLA